MIPNGQSIRDAIVRDLRAGLPYDEIVARNNVTRYRVRRVASAEGITRQAADGEGRPRVLCSFCGIETRSPAGICKECRSTQMVTWGTGDALPSGRWVPRRGVLRFIPEENPAPPYCGSEKGYQWHRHNDPENWPLPADDPCGCRAAHAEHFRGVAA